LKCWLATEKRDGVEEIAEERIAECMRDDETSMG
jgi:hypothetical protein